MNQIISSALFVLAVDDIARSVSTPLNIWYLDDPTLREPVEKIIHDLKHIIPAFFMICLDDEDDDARSLLAKTTTISIPLNCECEDGWSDQSSH